MTLSGSLFTRAALFASVLCLGLTSASAQRQIRGNQLILDDNGTSTNNTISLTTPADADLPASYSLILPTGLPVTGQFGLLGTNSAGQLSYTTVGAAQNNYLLAVIGGAPTFVNPSDLTTLWSTAGNAGLMDGTSNFFGTRDNVGLNFITGGTANVRLAIAAGGAVNVNSSLNLNGNTVPLSMNGAAGTANQVLVSRGPGLTPQWADLTSVSNSWLVGGNTTPSSTLIGNNAANGDLDIRAGNATRVNISGTSGLVTINNGLSIHGAAAADNQATLGAATTAGRLIISDGTTNTGTLVADALTANHTYNLPDLGAVPGTVTLTAAAGQGTAGQVLVSQGAGQPASWQTSTALRMVAGIADPVNGSMTVVVNPNVILTSSSIISITHISSVGGGAYVSTITAGIAGVGTFTVTLPGPAAASDMIHWFVIP